MIIGNKVIRFEKITSTNDYIKDNIDKLSPGDIIHALEQTKGRGRFGNTWQSVLGNLYFSFLQEPIDNVFDLHLKISVVIVKLLNNLGIEAKIKYPNDIIVNKRKIAGILVETKGYSTRNIIVGIGININQKDFYELNNLATSIALETNKTVDVYQFLLDFIKLYNEIDMNIFDRYIKDSIIIGTEVTYKEKLYEVKGITKSGEILLVNNDEEKIVGFDSISLSSIYN